MAFDKTLTAASSSLLRLSAFIALRMIPAHFHLITFALFATWIPSFFRSFSTQPEVEVLSDEVDITVVEKPASAADPVPDEPIDEVVVTERVLLEEKYPPAWKVLLYGLPSRQHPILSALTFVVNSALVAMAADALFRATLFHPADDLSFVRLGYVSPTEANFLIREPDPSQWPVTMEIHIKDPRSAADNILWQQVGGLTTTDQDTDYTGLITVPLTHPRQHYYEWRTSNNHTGEFLAPPKAGSLPEYHDGKFTFLSTSCILPHFPYNPLDHPLSIPGMRHLARKLPDLGAQFMLFLGDFIYVDVPRRFGKTAQEYSKQYRQVYASPDWAPVGQNLSWIHVLDDHEIANDWSEKDTGVYNAAIKPWNIYHASVNPPPPAVQAGSLQTERPPVTWFSFVQGPASFFMMDTRSQRSSNSAPFDAEDKAMLGPDQLKDLLAWLARPEPSGVRWKIITSSVPLTKNWPVNVQDTWGGFLAERKKVLEGMWESSAQGYGVVTLSGDRHEFAATRFPPPADSKWSDKATVYEFSTSPLNQFASPVGTYKQSDDEDVMMEYISSGMSKFAAITIENVSGESTLQFRLYIDGEEAWSTLLVAPHAPQADASFASIWNKIKFA